MPKKLYNEEITTIIKAIEDYKAHAKYKESEVGTLKKEIEHQRKVVKNLDDGADVLASTPASISDEMLTEKDKLRDLERLLRKREKVAKDLETKMENLQTYVNNLTDRKKEILDSISNMEKENEGKARRIKELQDKQDKTETESEELIQLINERAEREETKRGLRAELLEINKALKTASEYYKSIGLEPNKDKEDKEKDDKEHKEDKEKDDKEHKEGDDQGHEENAQEQEENNQENNVDKTARIAYLKTKITEWEEELETVWAGKNTDAAEVERRNLKNLIANARREIDEIENGKREEPKVDRKKAEPEPVRTTQMIQIEINKLKLHIERLKEEQEEYAGYKEGSIRRKVFDEYQRKIEEAERKLDSLNLELQTKEERDKEDIEKTRFFHGQGDMPERGVDTNDRENNYNGDNKRANNEFFGIGHDGKTPDEPEPGTQGEIPIEPDPKPESEPGTQGEIPVEPDPKPEPEPEEKVPEGQEKYPTRSFWEIIDDTSTEHIGSIPMLMYNLAHPKFFPNWRNKDGDGVSRFFDVLNSPFALAGLVLARTVGNVATGFGVTRAGKKLKILRENIDDLSPEEFRVLVSSPKEIERIFGKGVKDEFDKDYLDPQLMKQHKMNDLFLRAVGERLSRENVEIASQSNNYILQMRKRIDELDDLREKRELSPEELKEYEDTTRMIMDITEEGKHAVSEISGFYGGAEKKTYGYMNIKGWFLGRFNPDTREKNKEMARLSRERREAARDGDFETVAKSTNEMRRYAESQTTIKRAGIFKGDRIDIGKTSIEAPVELLNRGKDTRFTNLLSFAALAVSVKHLITSMKVAKANKAIIEQKNAEIRNANARNKDIRYSGESKVADAPGSGQAQSAYARNTTEQTFNRNERANLDEHDWTGLNGESFRSADSSIHSKASETRDLVDSQISSGDTRGAVVTAQEYANSGVSQTNQTLSGYEATHNFDMTGTNYSSGTDATTLGDFLINGTIPYSGTVSGVAISEIAGLDFSSCWLPTLLTTMYKTASEASRHNTFVDGLHHPTKKKESPKSISDEEDSVQHDDSTETVPVNEKDDKVDDDIYEK